MSRDEAVMKIVDQALEMDPAARPEFLNAVCAADPTLRADVEKLLVHEWLAQRVFESGTDTMRSVPPHIDNYRLLDVIGEGGMGVVWRAEQREPIKRIVALKLIKLGMDTEAVVARFESERQALALMNHPNVAAVFDAGATSTGRPYFVMEYVAGEPITRFCDRHQYSVPQRLELFVQACEAVQHAHQKAILHRDLKPSNILVAMYADKARVKVIDFGVAKATAQRLTERTMFTETGQLIGTPEYMSPEQAEMTSLDVDTRSDIYSLGVVLYELLSGALPFDPRNLREAGFNEIQRIIREVDPPRLSTRFSGLGEQATQVAHHRRTQVAELSRQLRGELEWIPLKAMRKDRLHRYATATELSQDVRNYLEQRPLTAGPESAAYRARKFLKRNKVPVAAAALLAIALLGGIVSTSVALVGQTRARAEADRQRAAAEAVSSFLTEDVLAAAGPDRLSDKSVRDAVVTKMIDPAAAAVAKRFKDNPLIEAAVQNSLSLTYHQIGRADLGLPLASAALKTRRRIQGDDHADTIVSINTFGMLLGAMGRLDEAESLYREALERRRRQFGNDHLHTLLSLHNLGSLLQSRGKFDEAEPLYRQALEGRRRVLGDDNHETILSINNLGQMLQARGDLDQAEPLLREALERSHRVLGSDHPDTSMAAGNLAVLLQNQGKRDEAEPLLRQTLEHRRRVLGDDHPITLTSINNLAYLLQAQNRLDQAEPLWRESLERCRRVHGSDHPDTLRAINNLGFLLRSQGKLDQAEQLWREALEGYRRVLGTDHPDTVTSINNLGALLKSQGKIDQAEPLFEEIYRSTAIEKLPPKHAAQFYCRYGLCLAEMGKYQQAYEPLSKAYTRLISAGLGKHERVREVVAALAEACEKTQRSDEAAKWRGELATLQPATKPGSNPTTARN